MPSIGDQNPHDVISAHLAQLNLDMRDVVYLIESPSAQDLLDGRHEGDAILRILRLAEIDVVYFLATNEETFSLAFDRIAHSALQRSDLSTAMPYIHISAHGSDDGIELTDGDVIFWEKLNNLLESLNSRIGPILMIEPFPQDVPKSSLCLSSCGAFTGYCNNLPTKPAVQAVIGATKDVGWCEALIAFSTFYYQTQILNVNYEGAVLAMNLAAGSVRSGVPTYSLMLTHSLPTDEAYEVLAKRISYTPRRRRKRNPS